MPLADFAPSVPGLPDSMALILARAGGIADAAIGLALLRNWRPKPVAWAQLLMVLGYTCLLYTSRCV